MIIKSLAVFCILQSGEGVEEKALKATLSKHDAARIAEVQHEITENIRKFKDNLEGLRTTVDFEPITV
jgi:hypothetical protein